MGRGGRLLILLDTNIWLALALSKHDFHAVASDWFAAQAKPKSILFCRSTQQSLLRLLTTDLVMRRYGDPPLSNTGAWQLVEAFLADSRITFAAEPQALEAHWKSLASRRTASPKLWMDAYLAAFAIAGRHQLITTDSAFTQFHDLDLLVMAITTAP